MTRRRTICIAARTFSATLLSRSATASSFASAHKPDGVSPWTAPSRSVLRGGVPMLSSTCSSRTRASALPSSLSLDWFRRGTVHLAAVVTVKESVLFACECPPPARVVAQFARFVGRCHCGTIICRSSECRPLGYRRRARRTRERDPALIVPEVGVVHPDLKRPSVLCQKACSRSNRGGADPTDNCHSARVRRGAECIRSAWAKRRDSDTLDA